MPKIKIEIMLANAQVAAVIDVAVKGKIGMGICFKFDGKYVTHSHGVNR